jgi:ABC-2 type transport system permease protein
MLLRTIATKEFRELLRDGRFRWAGGIVAGLLLVAGLAGFTAWREQSAQRDAAQATMQASWFNQPPKNPHSAAHYGLWAFKPQMPLAFVDRGVDPYTGTASWLEAHRMNEFRFRPAMDATAAQRFGEWTAAGVLQQLIPLLIILLGFSAFAGERERGTLRQLASLGVPTATLLRGKALGVTAALAVLCVPAAVLGSAAVLMAAGIDGVLRLAALSAVYVAYFGIVLTITLVVSARARSARAALITLLALWAANGLLVPRVAADAARAAFPTPTAREFQAQVQRGLASGIDGHSPSGARAEALRDSVLAANDVPSVDSLPFNYDGFAMQRGEEHANEVYGHYFGQLWDRFAQQDRTQLVGAVVAPVIAVRFLSMGIAGTDFGQHRAFAEQAEAYRQEFNRVMNDNIRDHAHADASFSYQADSTLWRSIPAFEYEAPSLGRVLAAHGASIGVVLGWLALSALLVGRERRIEVI